MKILLCSPYLNSPKVISGGINIWANNILTYHSQIDTDIEIIPVSFDRRIFVAAGSNMFRRAFLGIMEYRTAIKDARTALSAQNIDVVHVCTSASISLVKDIILLRLAKRYGAKTVIHFHFGRIPRLLKKNNWERKLLNKVMSLASTALTMDMKSYESLCAKGYINVAYCPNPLSAEIINQIEIEKSEVKRVPNKVLFVGQVLPSKGVYELVESCCGIDGIELHIVGKVEESVKSKMEAIAQIKDGGKWIYFHGEVPHNVVIREMLSASLFVLPSYTEGFPNVILEAMASETPIVSTTVGAVPEMLDINSGNECGKCVSPKDVDALRKAIISFIQDVDYSSCVAMRSLARVHQLYAMPKVWNELVKIWES